MTRNLTMLFLCFFFFPNPVRQCQLLFDGASCALRVWPGLDHHQRHLRWSPESGARPLLCAQSLQAGVETTKNGVDDRSRSSGRPIVCRLYGHVTTATTTTTVTAAATTTTASSPPTASAAAAANLPAGGPAAAHCTIRRSVKW